MNAVNHFRHYLAEASDEKLQQLRTIRVLGPDMFAVIKVTVGLRQIVEREVLYRALLKDTFRKTA